MFGNLVVLVVTIAIAIGFGYLTLRLVRSQRRRLIKIPAALLAGALTLLFAAIAFMGGKGIAAIYFPGAPAAPSIDVAGTPEQIARGGYLVNISCANCHTAADANGLPSGQPPLSGGVNLLDRQGFGFIGAIVTENLTPGGKLAGYTDGELFRALRHNIDQQGYTMAAMAYMPYGQLSDDDIQAIIAYLRSQPAARTAGQTGDNLNFIGAVIMGAGLFGPPLPPAPDTITAPPRGVTAEYGKYVASFGECRGCHGPDMTGKAKSLILPAVPNARPYASILSQEQFTQLMRTGVKPGGVPFPPSMPWRNAARMDDEDLSALYEYLKGQ